MIKQINIIIIVVIIILAVAMLFKPVLVMITMY